jgi:hypothetical protein
MGATAELAAFSRNAFMGMLDPSPRLLLKA